MQSRPLLEMFAGLEARLPFARLGDFPTPITPLDSLAAALGRPDAELYEKRDDLTSTIYGGNKVRTLEVLFGDALARGASHVFSTGAYGSNHAMATVFHAARVGLRPGIALYPQPPSSAALENLEVMLAREPVTYDLPHWSFLLYGMWRVKRDLPEAYVMEPGGAVPLGALGYASAALELAQQVARGDLPEPKRIVVAVGSNCTAAGLLLGTHLAQRRGFGFVTAPTIVAVRVTPFPITIPFRILKLASEASELLARLTGEDVAVDRRTLAPQLVLERRFIGRGYGYATAAGRAAMQLWQEHAGHELETTYSGKAAAAVIDVVKRASLDGPTLYWSTKSSLPLPSVTPAQLAHAPAAMRRWMERVRRA